MGKVQNSVEHTINETYLDLLANSKGLQDFIIGETAQTSEGYRIKVITCGNPDAWDVQFEDRLKIKIADKAINIDSIEVKRVSMRQFIERTLKLEDILQRKIGCNFLTPGNSEKFAQDLFTIAGELRSSDVHIYPVQKKDALEGAIKMRVDGRLRTLKYISEKEFRDLTTYLHARVPDASRTNVRSLEGCFFLNGDRETSYRLSSMQTNASKNNNKSPYSSVIRVLRTKDITFSLGELGYLGPDEGKIRSMIRERRGVIVISGGVGEGKSTTLASLVTEIARTNNEEVKIVTIEDPPEYHIPSALQIKVTANENAENELTYAEAIKNCLRQDPDVVMIGEVRDKPTAKYLFDLAHTGNLALTTFHGSNVSNVLTRLASYEIGGLVMCGSLLGIISQVLIRQNCDNCSKTRGMNEEERDYFFQKPLAPNGDYDEFIRRNKLPEIAESNGQKNGRTCEKCEGTGFFQRRPIVEIYNHSIDNDDMIYDICNGNPNGRKKLKQLFQEGIHEPFALGALNMVLYGATSPREIMNVLPASYFRDYSALLIKRTNQEIKAALEDQVHETQK